MDKQRFRRELVRSGDRGGTIRFEGNPGENRVYPSIDGTLGEGKNVVARVSHSPLGRVSTFIRAIAPRAARCRGMHRVKYKNCKVA